MLKKVLLVLSITVLSLGGFQVLAKKENTTFKDLELFNKALYLVQKNYFKEVDTTKLIKGAIKGMLSTLDPHSNFLDEDLFERMKNDTEGEFGGVGIEVSFKDGLLVIITAIDDTPAYKKGVKSGDKIVEINKENAVGLALSEAIEKMKGKVGEVLHLGVRREGSNKIIHFSLKRELIKIKPVKSDFIKGYGFLRLSQFQNKSTEHVAKAIKELKAKHKNIKGLILDLRSNPGGLLSEAVGVSSIFLDKGVVVSTESRDPEVKDIRYVRKTGYKDLSSKLAVLVDGASASASEIVAGALQDYGRAYILGENSFGKGTVQSVTPIDKKIALKLTISQYLTPKKRKIHKIGIKPDHELKKMKRSKESGGKFSSDKAVLEAITYLDKSPKL